MDQLKKVLKSPIFQRTRENDMISTAADFFYMEPPMFALIFGTIAAVIVVLSQSGRWFVFFLLIYIYPLIYTTKVIVRGPKSSQKKLLIYWMTFVFGFTFYREIDALLFFVPWIKFWICLFLIALMMNVYNLNDILYDKLITVLSRMLSNFVYNLSFSNRFSFSENVLDSKKEIN